MRIKALMRPRSDWNRRGPHVSLWFRLRLKALDPALVLQFVPPRSPRDPRGVPHETYPRGVWDICRVLPKSGLLHPVAVWSLVDVYGDYASPGPDTLRLLIRAMWYHRQGLMHLMEAMLENSMESMRSAKALRSKELLVRAMGKYMSLYGSRQWQNRVYMKRGGRKDQVPRMC